MNMGLEKAPFFLHPKFKHLMFKNCILIKQGQWTYKKSSISSGQGIHCQEILTVYD